MSDGTPINGELQRRSDRDERGRFLPKHGVKSPGRPPGRGIEAAEAFHEDLFAEYRRRRAAGTEEDVLKNLLGPELAALMLKVSMQRTAHRHQREMGGSALGPEEAVARMVQELGEHLDLSPEQYERLRAAADRVRGEITTGDKRVAISFAVKGDEDL